VHFSAFLFSKQAKSDVFWVSFRQNSVPVFFAERYYNSITIVLQWYYIPITPDAEGLGVKHRGKSKSEIFFDIFLAKDFFMTRGHKASLCFEKLRKIM